MECYVSRQRKQGKRQNSLKWKETKKEVKKDTASKSGIEKTNDKKTRF